MNRLAVNVIVVFCLLLFLILTLWGLRPSKPAPNTEAPPKQTANEFHDILVQGESIAIPAPAGASLERILAPGGEDEGGEENRIRIRFLSTRRGHLLVYLLGELSDTPGPMTAGEFDIWKKEWLDEADRHGALKEDIPQPPAEYADRIVFLEGGETLPVGDDGKFLTTETSVKGGKYAGNMFVTRMLVKDIPLAVTVLALAEAGEADDPLPLAVAWREAILRANQR